MREEQGQEQGEEATTAEAKREAQGWKGGQWSAPPARGDAAAARCGEMGWD